NALLMAATHDIELTYLTPGYLQRHFREEMTEAGMTFPYKLMDGPCTTRNAIKLLDVMAFPSAVIQQARALAERFDQSGQWR
ncbi:MAG: DNA mismatch repair protein MutS, partial [Clostridia bacterium]